MQLFLMLLSALLSDAIVMDGKVKEAFVQDKASVTCSYDPYYKNYPKYWCKGYYRNYCNVIASTPNSTNRVSLKDTGMQFIITLTCLTKEDTGWYWCGIQRDYASDYMDYTELIVFDGVKDTADLQRKQNRTCKDGSFGYSGNHSRRTCYQPVLPLRLSVLSICILIMGMGIITTAIILLRRKRIKKYNRGKVLIRLGDHSLGPSPMIPTPLVSCQTCCSIPGPSLTGPLCMGFRSFSVPQQRTDDSMKSSLGQSMMQEKTHGNRYGPSTEEDEEEDVTQSSLA